MTKLVASIPDRQYEFVRRIADEKGIAIAEVVRRILDDYMSEYSMTNSQGGNAK